MFLSSRTVHCGWRSLASELTWHLTPLSESCFMEVGRWKKVFISNQTHFYFLWKYLRPNLPLIAPPVHSSFSTSIHLVIFPGGGSFIHVITAESSLLAVWHFNQVTANFLQPQISLKWCATVAQRISKEIIQEPITNISTSSKHTSVCLQPSVTAKVYSYNTKENISEVCNMTEKDRRKQIN